MSKLIPNLSEILSAIPAGEWVAISERQQQAIAHGLDARSVLNEARGQGERMPLMIRVPEPNCA
jgi:uncharacterized protein DUF5678